MNTTEKQVSNTHSFGKVILKSLLLLAAGIICGLLLMTLAYCIPVNMGNYYSSIETLEQEGWYPNVPVVSSVYNTYFQTYLPGVLDNNTVRSWMIPIAFATGDNPLYLAMSCNNYSYYWHGYVTILRPLLYFMDYETIQIANDYLQIALITILAVLIARKKGVRYVILLLSCYFLIMPMAVSVCVQYSSVFYIAYGGCLFLLLAEGYLRQKERFFYFFLILGMLTSFLDLLTYPLFTWGIPMVWWLILETKERGAGKFLREVILSGIAWVLGYGVMWAGKWVLASIILGENVIQSALNEVLFRSGTENEVTYGLSNRFYTIFTNWRHYSYTLYLILLLAWLMFWLLCGFFRGWKITDKCPALFLVGSSSLVWYLFLANHTQVHHAFTYRIFGITIAAFFAVVLESTTHHSSLRLSVGKWIQRGALCLCIFLLFTGAACIAAGHTREIVQVDNKSESFDILPLETESVQVVFTPEVDRIVGLGFGLLTESSTGYYEFCVSEGDTLLYREIVPVSTYNGYQYTDISLDWKLSSDKEYLLTITPYDVEGEIYLYYTADGNLPVSGFRYLEDGSSTTSQPLLGIQYWYPVLSKADKILLIGTYTAISFLLLFAAIYTTNKIRSRWISAKDFTDKKCFP